jgi:thiol:disulfide interchange protein DsbD
VAWLVLALQLLAPIPLPAGAAASAPHVTVRLVSEHAAITVGQRFWLGLEFALEPGWHLYWRNPGDTGQPPRITWTVPAGYRAGDIDWPKPERISVPPLVDFGFTGNVLLLVPFTASAAIGPDALAPIGADLSWLVCRDLCVSGGAHVAIGVKVSRRAEIDPAERRVFEAGRRSLPRPAPRTWRLAAQATASGFVMTVDTGRPVSAATFYPFEESQIDSAAAQPVDATPRGFRMTLKRADALKHTPAALRGVVTFPTGEAYVISAPVKGT